MNWSIKISISLTRIGDEAKFYGVKFLCTIGCNQ